MNDQKSASVDTAIKGCDTVINETLKNLANAYYFRGTAKFGKPTKAVKAKLAAIADLAELEDLGVRLLTANGWKELFAVPK